MIITRFIGYVLPWGLFLAQNDIEGAVVVGMAWAKPSPCQPSCSVF
jgi:hypothetical protein